MISTSPGATRRRSGALWESPSPAQPLRWLCSPAMSPTFAESPGSSDAEVTVVAL